MINVTFNEKINFPEVRVLYNEETLGVMNTKFALKKAKELNLDLILITDKVNPPVARIANLDKFKYEQIKHEKSINKKNRQNQIKLKELSFRINTDSFDFNRLIKKAKEYLEKNYKVKVTLLLKGRENSHKEIGISLLNEFVQKSSGKAEGKITESNKGLNIMILPQ